MAEFKLSASLAGHGDDVRGVCFPSAKELLSASRDGTVRHWKLLSDNPPVYDSDISSHAPTWMSTVAFLQPNEQYPEGLIISSGKDVVIDVRQPSKKPEDNAEALLLGHQKDVCALSVDRKGTYIVSGSWDHDARIWPVGKWESDVVLQGHQGSVWAVLAYDEDTIITACADQKVRIFNRAGKLQQSFQASEQPVRALCRVPRANACGADFATGDNEGVIRLWKTSGLKVGELHGHQSFIYSLDYLPTGELVSSGEDRTVRIWKGVQCIQTITHPAISIWAVAVCQETGDIVTGASDKTVRVFTRSSERVADAETTLAFETAVKTSSIPQQTVGTGKINKEKLPGPEFLTQKIGMKDGQVQMILEKNGAVTAHTWSTAQQQWVNVGTVVDGEGSTGRKTEYMGKEYDYVFDVDMEDGKPALKLPYDLSQNPYDAATKFLQDNESPMTYLEQVAEFIRQNTQGANVGPSGPEQHDPWGSDNRYRPGETSTPAPQPSAPKALPQKAYLNIITARVPAMQKKITELNQALITGGNKDLSLNPPELVSLSSLCAQLDSVGATKASQSIKGGLEMAVKIVTLWPYSDRLPGLDLLRLLAIAPETATFEHPSGANIIDVLETGATEANPPNDNFVMMAIRAFVNLFDSEPGRALAIKEFEKIQKIIEPAIHRSSGNRNLFVAIGTLYINYAVYFITTPSSSAFDQSASILETITKILEKEKDSEAVYRCLIAAGTLIQVSDEVKSVAKEVVAVLPAVEGAVQRAADPRIRNVGAEIRALLA